MENKFEQDTQNTLKLSRLQCKIKLLTYYVNKSQKKKNSAITELTQDLVIRRTNY